MAGRDIVVIGASAGGIQALQKLLPQLPKDLPAAIFVVVHRMAAAREPDMLAHVLGLRVQLQTHSAVDGEPIRRGHVYVGAPDRHMLVERGLIRLERSPKESWFRPSIDALFRSAAVSYGRRVVGVLLSGSMDDGTAGLWQIHKHGGITIVQDPAEAQHPAMPRSALANVPIDYCLPVDGIAQTLVRFTREQPAPPPLSGPRGAKVLIVEDERIVARNLEKRLAELGYEVTGCIGFGESVVEVAEQTRPDIVLMDIYLAGALTGTEAARQLWEQYQIPVVYVTAYADMDTLDQIKTTQPYGYVLKPFRTEEVHAAIQLALDRRDKEMQAHQL